MDRNRCSDDCVSVECVLRSKVLADLLRDEWQDFGGRGDRHEARVLYLTVTSGPWVKLEPTRTSDKCGKFNDAATPQISSVLRENGAS